MYELRVYGAEGSTLTKSVFDDPMAALYALASDTQTDKGFLYAWAECWLIQPTGDARQWKLIVD